MQNELQSSLEESQESKSNFISSVRFQKDTMEFLFQTQAIIETSSDNCVSLHSMLLEYDGLATRWDEESVAWNMTNP